MWSEKLHVGVPYYKILKSKVMTIEHKVIDNFFPLDVFDKLKTFLLPVDYNYKKDEDQIPWYYVPAGNVVKGQGKPDRTRNWKLFYLAHLIYEHTILSPFYNKIISHCSEPLDIKSLIRIKINMYPNTEIVKEHGMHIDYKFSHKAAILSINTCDGYTKLEDGTKIDSIANRMLLFDGSKPHTPSTCTDQPIRMNINFNYF